MSASLENGDGVCNDIDSKTQLILLQGGEYSNTYKITAKDVEIKTCKTALQNRAPSNKIRVNKIVSYDWEQKYYYGNVVAVHKKSEFFAYSLRTKSDGVVRIMHKKSSERGLLKTFTGRVVDLAFAHVDEVLLGCVDETASVKIFKIVYDESNNASGFRVQSTLVLSIASSLTNQISSETHRIVWCMYIPDLDAVENSEQPIGENASKVFLITNHKRADVYHLDIIEQNYTEKELECNQITKGHLVIDQHESTILCVAFSPDGSAIASASSDGDVNFFKISFTDDCEIVSNRLQCWKPHDSKAVTCLYFLDDHKNPSSDAQFWNFVVTGCDFNRELKIWCCIKWTCLQTIRFTSDDEIVPCLKTSIDLSSNFILLSDITRKAFYVLNTRKCDEDGTALAFAISDFPLAYPALSYVVDKVETSKIKNKKFNNSKAFGNENGSDSGDGSTNDSVVTMIQLFCIQTKQLLEMQVFIHNDASFFNNGSLSNRLNSSISFNSESKDLLSDVLSDLEQDLNSSRTNIANLNLANVLTINPSVGYTNGQTLSVMNNSSNNSSTPAPVLMTPDAFSNTPRRTSNENSSAQKPNDVLQSFMSASSRTSSLTHVTSVLNAQQQQQQVQIKQEALTPPNQNTVPLYLQEQSAKSDTYDQDEQVVSLSSSSSSGSTSSSIASSVSSSSDEAADKEIEAIVLPIEESQTEKLLQKVDLSQLMESQLLLKEDGNELQQQEHQQRENWPNPPSIITTTNPTRPLTPPPAQSITSKPQQHGNDSASLNELIQLVRTQHADYEKFKIQQQNQLNTLKLHFDASIARLSSNQTQKLHNNHLHEDQIVSRLEKTIKDELKLIVTPQLNKITEPFKEQIPKDIAEKLQTIENILKENVTKVFKSKTFMDSITLALGQSLQATIVNTYRDTFQKVLIPSFEKSCQNMYQQINQIFKKGTDEYLHEYDTYLKQQRKLYEDNKDILLSQLKQFNENFQSQLQQVNIQASQSIQTNLDQNLRNSNAILQDTIISSVKAIIKEELNLAMRDQQQYLPERLITIMRQSGTMTPISHMGGQSSSDTQEIQSRIMQNLQNKQYNTAFQVALCAADLALLMNLCENVNPAQIFEQKPCPLQQPVLLSLIQQLSQDLPSHTELKLKYLEDAVMNLDHTNALTREHMPSVINQLVVKLQQHLQSHPNDKLSKQIRMFLMASQSLLISR